MRHTARNLTVLGLGLSVSTVVGWLLLKEAKREKAPTTVSIFSQTTAEPTEIPQIVLPLNPNDVDDPAPPSVSVGPDDLTRINGIGPKFATALAAIGITQYTQLAQETPATLAEKLAEQITIRPQRIQDNNWIGQAADLAQQTTQ